MRKEIGNVCNILAVCSLVGLGNISCGPQKGVNERGPQVVVLIRSEERARDSGGCGTEKIRELVNKYGTIFNTNLQEQRIQEIEQALKSNDLNQHIILGSPSVTPEFIEKKLEEMGSPAQGTGQTWWEQGVKYCIDPAYAVAFFIHESTAGTALGWAGRKPDGSTTHNVGNIICAGYPKCYGRFRDYASWEEGIEDWYRLIFQEYVTWRGVMSVDDILPIYAPPVENNTQNYINTVKSLVDKWRLEQRQQGNVRENRERSELAHAQAWRRAREEKNTRRGKDRKRRRIER